LVAVSASNAYFYRFIADIYAPFYLTMENPQ
jgi:hypothetical protein